MEQPSIPVLSLIDLCSPCTAAETFTQHCCSLVCFFPWKGQVSLVLSLFIRQMIDTSWAQAPALCSLPWVVSLSLSPVEWSSVFMLLCQLVWPIWHLHLDVSQTSPVSHVLRAPLDSPFPNCFLCCLLTFSLSYFCIPVFGIICTCWMSGGIQHIISVVGSSVNKNREGSFLIPSRNKKTPFILEESYSFSKFF